MKREDIEGWVGPYNASKISHEKKRRTHVLYDGIKVGDVRPGMLFYMHPLRKNTSPGTYVIWIIGRSQMRLGEVMIVSHEIFQNGCTDIHTFTGPWHNYYLSSKVTLIW